MKNKNNVKSLFKNVVIFVAGLIAGAFALMSVLFFIFGDW